MSTASRAHLFLETSAAKAKKEPTLTIIIMMLARLMQIFRSNEWGSNRPALAYLQREGPWKREPTHSLKISLTDTNFFSFLLDLPSRAFQPSFSTMHYAASLDQLATMFAACFSSSRFTTNVSTFGKTPMHPLRDVDASARW